MNRTSVFLSILVITLLISGCVSTQAQVPSLVGKNAPDFRLDDALGGQTSLSDYDGTPVLLFFHMAVG